MFHECKEAIILSYANTLQMCSMFNNLKVFIGKMVFNEDERKFEFSDNVNSDLEITAVKLEDGKTIIVDITGDSGMAIIEDVWKGVEKLYDFNRKPKITYLRMEEIASKALDYIREEDREDFNSDIDLTLYERNYFCLDDWNLDNLDE